MYMSFMLFFSWYIFYIFIFGKPSILMNTNVLFCGVSFFYSFKTHRSLFHAVETLFCFVSLHFTFLIFSFCLVLLFKLQFLFVVSCCFCCCDCFSLHFCVIWFAIQCHNCFLVLWHAQAYSNQIH